MSDLISKGKLLGVIKPMVGIWYDETFWIDYKRVIDIIENLPSAEPDNQVHLCGFCKYGYPECPAEMSDVIFGNGIGHDNVCVCAKFEIKPERKKGEWIDEMLYQDFDESEWEKVKCSVCENFVTKQIFYHDNKYHYCPYCG